MLGTHRAACRAPRQPQDLAPRPEQGRCWPPGRGTKEGTKRRRGQAVPATVRWPSTERQQQPQGDDQLPPFLHSGDGPPPPQPSDERPGSGFGPLKRERARLRPGPPPAHPPPQPQRGQGLIQAHPGVRVSSVLTLPGERLGCSSTVAANTHVTLAAHFIPPIEDSGRTCPASIVTIQRHGSGVPPIAVPPIAATRCPARMETGGKVTVHGRGTQLGSRDSGNHRCRQRASEGRQVPPCPVPAANATTTSSIKLHVIGGPDPQVLPTTGLQEAFAYYPRWHEVLQGDGEYAEALETRRSASGSKTNPNAGLSSFTNMAWCHPGKWGSPEGSGSLRTQVPRFNANIPSALTTCVIPSPPGLLAEERRATPMSRNAGFSRAAEFLGKAIRMAPNNYIEAPKTG